jgi:hypothetical protein
MKPDHIFRAELKVAVSKDPTGLEVFIGKSTSEKYFTEIPWTDLIAGVGTALVVLNTDLKNLEGVIAKLRSLSGWLTGEHKSEKIAIGDRIIGVLARKYAKDGKGVTLEKLEKELMEPAETVHTLEHELKHLSTLGLVKNKGGNWIFQMPKD